MSDAVDSDCEKLLVSVDLGASNPESSHLNDPGNVDGSAVDDDSADTTDDSSIITSTPVSSDHLVEVLHSLESVVSGSDSESFPVPVVVNPETNSTHSPNHLQEPSSNNSQHNSTGDSSSHSLENFIRHSSDQSAKNSPDLSPDNSREHSSDESSNHSLDHSPSQSPRILSVRPAKSASVAKNTNSTDSLLSPSPVDVIHTSPNSSHMSIVALALLALPGYNIRSNTNLPESVLSHQSSVHPQQTPHLSIKDADAYLLSDDTEASIAVLQDSLAHLQFSPIHRNTGSAASPFLSRNSAGATPASKRVHRLPLHSKDKPSVGPIGAESSVLDNSPTPSAKLAHRLPLLAKNKPMFGPVDLDSFNPDGAFTPWSEDRHTPQKNLADRGLDLPFTESARAGSPDSHVVHAHNEQITGYRIQIKLLKQFIQKLLAAKPNVELPSDLENSFERLDRENSDNEYNQLVQELASLQETHADVLDLNEQMCTNLENFKNQLKQKEMLLAEANHTLDTCIHNLDNLLQLAGSAPESGSSQASPDTDNASQNIAAKFQALAQCLEKPTVSQPTHLMSPPQSRNQPVSLDVAQLNRVHELQGSIFTLEQELKQQKLANESLEKLLKNEIDQARFIEGKHLEMVKKIEDTCSTDSPQDSSAGKPDGDREISDTVGSSKLNEYRQIINQLQKEVLDVKQYAESLARPQESIQAELQQQISTLSQDYEKSKQAYMNTITSLTDQLHRQKEQIDEHIDHKNAMDKMRYDLEIAVEKQRVYKSDNIRLGYKSESLAKEKTALQATIDKLTERINEYASSQNDDDKRMAANLLHELFETDVYEFQKLIESFNKIADDDSLQAPIKKINKMSHRLEKLTQGSPSNEDVAFLRECHRSVFEYFVRAVDMIVNDHIKILLQENEDGLSNKDYVASLRDQVTELLSVNETLSRKIDELESRNGAFTSHESIPSPTIEQLRILELQTRWKSEREARVYESNQADIRLREVEAENKRLRQVLEDV